MIPLPLHPLGSSRYQIVPALVKKREYIDAGTNMDMLIYLDGTQGARISTLEWRGRIQAVEWNTAYPAAAICHLMVYYSDNGNNRRNQYTLQISSRSGYIGLYTERPTKVYRQEYVEAGHAVHSIDPFANKGIVIDGIAYNIPELAFDSESGADDKVCVSLGYAGTRLAMWRFSLDSNLGHMDFLPAMDRVTGVYGFYCPQTKLFSYSAWLPAIADKYDA